ncbi:hypothetical protein ACWGR4_39670 [Embleya sp. NPDC055664]
MNSVSTSVNNNLEFSSEDKTTLGSVGTKFGISVATNVGSTKTTTQTRTVHLNQPGVYGLYRGTERVEGEWIMEICGRNGINTGKWVWVNGSSGTYVTYTSPRSGHRLVCPGRACGHPARDRSRTSALLIPDRPTNPEMVGNR